MTHHTDAERALFEAVASDDGKWPKAIERDAKGNYLLMQTAQGWRWWQEAWQAARRAPAVPHGLKITEEMHVAAVKVLHRASCVDGLPQRMFDAMLAAAPQPPEAAQLDDTNVADMAQDVDSKEAAPVQLPEYGIDTANHAGIRVRGYTKDQVRTLLAQNGIKTK